MASSSVVARTIALAVLGYGAASSVTLGQNVTAFNPYSGVGLPGGPTPQYGPQAAYPIVDTVGPGAGPAFNPWSGGVQAPGASVGVPAQVYAGPAMGGPVVVSGREYVPPAFNDSRGSYLPAPPPGPIESRIVAIPEVGGGRGAPRDLISSAPAYTPPPAPAPVAPPVAVAPPPAPTPAPVPVARPATPPALPPVVATPAPAPAPAAAPTPPPAPPRPVTAATPAPAPVATPAPPPVTTTTVPARPATAPSGGAVAASVAFGSQSAELSDAAKADLDRVAKNINDRSLRQVELRAHTGSNDPESRKVSLARALIVRSYLIDKGVKSRIEIGAFAGDGGDRVDILVPNS